MHRPAIVSVVAFLAAGTASASDDACAQLNGAMILNSDDEYIGMVAPTTARDSIFNEFGPFGSPFRSQSIWNEFGKNGSEFRNGSAFNEFTSRPPRLIKDGEVVGYLTVNKSKAGGVSPYVLGIVCYDAKPPR